MLALQKTIPEKVKLFITTLKNGPSRFELYDSGIEAVEDIPDEYKFKNKDWEEPDFKVCSDCTKCPGKKYCWQDMPEFELKWHDDALKKVMRIPISFIRNMAVKRIEQEVKKEGTDREVTMELFEKYRFSF